MNFFRSFLLLMSTPFLIFSACQGDKTALESGAADSLAYVGDSLSRDSDALVLALTPTVNCLPVYYAHQSGIFKTLGLKVNVKTYRSQFDCDTAMLGTTAMGGATDLVRLHYYAHQGQKLSAVAATDGDWKLLVCGTLRIKKTSLLKERMIAVARFSASDVYSEEALKASKMDYNAVFRPQINDYYLRTSMLNNNQVDAAVLPEPLATKARLTGHRVLYATSAKSSRMGCLAFKPSVLEEKETKERVELFLKGYNQAVEDLNKNGKTVCRDILVKDYKLTPQVVDSLTLPKYMKAAMSTDSEIKKAQEFLQVRNRWSGESASAELFNADLLPK